MDEEGKPIEAQITALRQRLTEARARIPAHTTPPGLMAEIDGLESELERLRHAAARETNRVREVIERGAIDGIDSLRRLGVEFFQGQWKAAVFGRSDAPGLPEEVVWQAATEVLERKYTGGLKGALMAVRLGVDSGIRGVIEHVYRFIRDTHVNAWRRYVTQSSIPPPDWDARLAAAREFLGSVSPVVPGESQVNAGELALRIYECIERHLRRTSLAQEGASGTRHVRP